ncbi:hypothetical protein UFOVP998_41 [uncultured Caudovirales phage]|uniref:Uncharacterized protein n=1 Tax=uncultured Caudovirales phage TaxID=2100421 RepID=A0A6J7XD89_9CAUD|nr:hypothetical protein UFOVP998_41 [uncultured Caudovirales phage]CAB4199083.1 hypothetical protein UFOVP1331_18 [uncultured Caudovirales phage]CAB4213087.1 hypothetical protein UFOVP1442_57 [uncultured Caudovirales phage]CAB5228097.1 hypothetical protein UFOVP1535_56 [uncultured Caudovirales phage]
MSTSGFVRSTPRPSGDRRSLESQREVLWTLRDYFLRSRTEGPRHCAGNFLCSECGDTNASIDASECRHEALIEDQDHHGNFTKDTERLSAIEDAIELLDHRLTQLAISDVHERQVA